MVPKITWAGQPAQGCGAAFLSRGTGGNGVNAEGLLAGYGSKTNAICVVEAVMIARKVASPDLAMPGGGPGSSGEGEFCRTAGQGDVQVLVGSWGMLSPVGGKAVVQVFPKGPPGPCQPGWLGGR